MWVCLEPSFLSGSGLPLSARDTGTQQKLCAIPFYKRSICCSAKIPRFYHNFFLSMPTNPQFCFLLNLLQSLCYTKRNGGGGGEGQERDEGGTGNVGQQSTKVRPQRILCSLFVFLPPPPLLFSCPEWLGWAERAPIVLAEEHPRLQASPPPLFPSLGEESRLALIHHPNHVYECAAISRAKQLAHPKKLAMFSKHLQCAFSALDIMRSRKKRNVNFTQFAYNIVKM